MELFKLLGTIAIDTSGVDEAVNTVKSKVQSLGESLTSAGDKISSLGTSMSAKLTAPLVALGTVSAKTAANFEDGMLKVQSLTCASGEELEKLTEKAKELGASTAWTAKDVSDAMGYMALAGFDTNQILESIGGMLSLASASGEDLSTVTDILTDSMTAFGDTASDAARYADVLATTQAKSNTTVGLLGEAFKYVAPLAGSYGYKLEDVSTALGVMANAGVKGSMAGTALSSIITRLGTNTDGCRDTIEELGVSFYNSDGTARNLSEVLKDLADKTQSLSVAEKAEIAKKVAGQEAQKGLLAVINQGSVAYSDLEYKIKSCGGVADEMAKNMESGLGGSLRSLKSALEGVAITLGENLAPIIVSVSEKIKAATVWFQGLSDKTQENIVKFGLFVAAAGPILLVVGKVISLVGSVITVGSKLVTGVGALIKIGTTLFSGITTIASFIGTTLVPAIASIGAPVLIVIGVITALVAIGVALYKNWDEISAWASKVWNGIKDTVSGAFESISNTVSEVGTKIKNSVHSFCENAENRWNEMKDKASETWNNIKDGAIEGWESIKTNVVERCEKVKTEAAEKFNDLKERWSENFTKAKDAIIDVTSQLREGAVAKIEELRSGASEKMEHLRSSISNTFDNLSSACKGIFENIASVGASGFNKIREVGGNAISGLSSFTQNAFQAMGDAIGGKFQSIFGGIGDTFEGVKDRVANIIGNIKSFFEFDWKLPDIKLPHFSIGWDTDGIVAAAFQKLGLKGLPHLQVEWYAKGGVMEQPTAFGINGNSLMVGGEAGKEAIAPITTLKQYIKEAMDERDGRMEENLQSILNMMQQYMPSMANRQVVLSTGETVGALAEPMNVALGKLAYKRERER